MMCLPLSRETFTFLFTLLKLGYYYKVNEISHYFDIFYFKLREIINKHKYNENIEK